MFLIGLLNPVDILINIKLSKHYHFNLKPRLMQCNFSIGIREWEAKYESFVYPCNIHQQKRGIWFRNNSLEIRSN